jgi:hypothetical protein
MKAICAVMILVAAAAVSDWGVTSNRFPELGLINRADTATTNSPRKSQLEPSDNLIDSVLSLPVEYFALWENGTVNMDPQLGLQ